MTSTSMCIEDVKKKIESSYQFYDAKCNYGGWGWCTLEKAHCLLDYVFEIRNRKADPVCVEIGVFMGKSMLPVAIGLQNFDAGKIYAIDPWSNHEACIGYTDENRRYWSSVQLDLAYEYVVQLVVEQDLTKYVEVLRTTSDLAPVIQNIDLLHIDGQHADQVVRDIHKFASEVAPDGYVVVDDMDWISVYKVRDLLDLYGFSSIHKVDTAEVFRRQGKKSYI